MFRADADFLQLFPRVRRQIRVRQRDLVQPYDRVHGGTDFVAHAGQKRGFRHIGLFCLFQRRAQLFVAEHLFALCLCRVAFQDDIKAGFRVDGIKVKVFIIRLPVALNGDIDRVRLPDFYLFFHGFQRKRFQSGFPRRRAALDCRGYLMVQIIAVTACARRGKNTALLNQGGVADGDAVISVDQIGNHIKLADQNLVR